MSQLPWWDNADAPFEPGHGLGRRVDPAPPRLPRMAALLHEPITVNRRLNLPRQYIPRYDQGIEGACVGFAWSWAMSILNRRFYAARKLYVEAQYIDPWTDTPPEAGTSVYSGAQVLLTQGHWRFARGLTFPLAAAEGIQGFRLAMTVDELRHAISEGRPFVLGVNWYSDFDEPKWTDPGKGGSRWWIGLNPERLGRQRGGHAICCFGARDDIDAFVLVNSWGVNYPIVQVPYNTVARLLSEDGEAIIPIDR